MADRELVVQVVHEVGRRARGEDTAGLAHPSAIRAKLADQLGRAQAAAPFALPGRAGAVLERALAPLLAREREHAAATVEVLHQLDHLLRLQDERIAALEGEIEQLRRATP